MGARKKPWDKRREESDGAYNAFSMYLEMPNRSIQKVADLLSKKRQQLDDWARKFDWKDRATAYDSSVVEALRQDKIKRRKKLAERLDIIGFLMIDRAEEAFRTISTQKISARAATEMADVGSKLAVQSLELDSGEEDTIDKSLTINIVRAGEGDAQ